MKQIVETKDIASIVTIADIHFDAPHILNEVLYKELCDNFINKIKDKPPTIIAIVGDLFDRKMSMNSDAVVYCNKFIYRLKTEFPNTYILLIHGTLYHDYMQLDSYSQYVDEKFRIYKSVTVDYIAGMKFLIIPEEYYPDIKVYDPYINVAENEKYDFVFYHGLFTHVGSYAKLEGSRKNKVCFSYIHFSKSVYGAVVCGHIHIHSEYKNIDYNGSFSRWMHGEEADKGFFRYTYNILKHKIIHKEFIVNPDAPIYKSIDSSSLSKDIKTLYKEIKKLADTVASLRIIIEPDITVSDSELQNIVSIVSKFDNVILHKIKPKIIVTPTEDDEVAMEERRRMIEKYSKKSFELKTKEFAKENFNIDITDEDIEEVLR